MTEKWNEKWLKNARGVWNVDPAPRVGGVRPKTKKNIVTSLILMVEVIADVPKGTFDGSARVKNVLELL